MAALELVGETLIFAVDLVMDLVGAIFSLFIRILRIAFEVLMPILNLLVRLLEKILRFSLGFLFGWLKKIVDDVVKALLLLEFEKLLKRKESLGARLEEDGETLGELVDLIGDLLDAGFEQRLKRSSARSLVGSFDVKKLSRYEEIKRRALEYERVVFRCFVVRQKLKLYDIDGRLHEVEK